MRIISQNKEHDLPYEHCAIWTKIPENIIYATPIGEADTLLQMARYTTAEKAEKAMQKLHECYLGIQVTHMPEFDGGDSFLNSIGIYKISENGEYAHKLPNRERIFRFPQEEEI